MIVLMGPLPSREDRAYWAGRGVPVDIASLIWTHPGRRRVPEETCVCEHPGDRASWDHLASRCGDRRL